VSGAPELPLWTEDGFEAPDTVSRRMEEHLSHTAGNGKMSDTSQTPLETL
jgi:hypothetical protein